MYGSSLLAHLAKNFAPHPENIATEALGHILVKYPSAARALTSVLSGTDISDDLVYQTQQAEGEGQARPDLTGKDDQGRNVVLIEAKFWAGLTDNQPRAYLGMLPDDVPSVLCFVAPQERLISLWPEICSRATSSGYEIKVTMDGVYKSAELGGKQRLILTAWGNVLAALESAANMSGDTSALSDISQLRGLCEQEESDGFLPIRPSEFGPETPRGILGLINVIDQVINGLSQEGKVSLQGLRATPVRTGYRRYINPVPLVFNGNGNNLWLEYNLDLWNQHEHPVWLCGGREYRRLASRGFDDYERASPRRLLKDVPEEVSFRIDLRVGAEIDEVVRAAAGQVEEIIARFQGLTG